MNEEANPAYCASAPSGVQTSRSIDVHCTYYTLALALHKMKHTLLDWTRSQNSDSLIWEMGMYTSISCRGRIRRPNFFVHIVHAFKDEAGRAICQHFCRFLTIKGMHMLFFSSGFFFFTRAHCSTHYVRHCRHTHVKILVRVRVIS